MYEALFHPAIWMPALLGIVGVAVFIYGNARVQTRVRLAGVGVVALTLVWCVAAYVIDTPVEQCVNRTYEIVAAVENAQWDRLRQLLDKNTAMENLRGAQIAQAAQNNFDAWGLKAVHIPSKAVDTGVGTIDVSINTFVEARYNTTATFKFEYEQRSDGILLAQIVPVSIGSANVDQIHQWLGLR